MDWNTLKTEVIKLILILFAFSLNNLFNGALLWSSSFGQIAGWVCYNRRCSEDTGLETSRSVILSLFRHYLNSKEDFTILCIYALRFVLRFQGFNQVRKKFLIIWRCDAYKSKLLYHLFLYIAGIEHHMGDPIMVRRIFDIVRNPFLVFADNFQGFRVFHQMPGFVKQYRSWLVSFSPEDVRKLDDAIQKKPKT